MKKESVLVLGCGNSRDQRLKVASKEDLEHLGPKFDDNFEDVWTIDMDPAAKPRLTWDLTSHIVMPGGEIKLNWPVPSGYFDELHAYEVLEHLTDQGDYKMFFALWRKIWEVLKPGGLVCATTPWWQSIWVWQDPGHKMCYSHALLTYLNQDQYEEQVGVTSMTDYRKFWPKPYSFTVRVSRQYGDDPIHAGFQFVLQKEGK